MNEKVFVISRKKFFLASHNLEGRPLHIHKFEVTFDFSGNKEHFQNGYNDTLLLNYFIIDDIWKQSILPLLVDKKTKRIIIANSTCEVLAEWIFDTVSECRNMFSNCLLKRITVFDGDVSASVQLGDQ